MKKTILRTMTFVIILIIALGLVACSVPHDFKEARSNLRDNEYTVTVYNKDVVISNKYSVILKMLSGYVYDEDTTKEIDKIVDEIQNRILRLEKDLEKVLIAGDEDYENILFALYFGESKTAREYYDLVEDIFAIGKREGLNAFDEIKKSDLTYGVTGAVVYFGTKDAVKASR